MMNTFDSAGFEIAYEAFEKVRTLTLAIAGSPDTVADSFFKGAVMGFLGYR